MRDLITHLCMGMYTAQTCPSPATLAQAPGNGRPGQQQQVDQVGIKPIKMKAATAHLLLFSSLEH
eukprot:scaffold77284_cov26-Tisochrysis_lutea.AAC.1